MSNPKDIDRKFKQLVAAETKNNVQHFAYTVSAAFFAFTVVLGYWAIWVHGELAGHLWESSLLSLLISTIMLRIGIWLRGYGDGGL